MQRLTTAILIALLVICIGFAAEYFKNTRHAHALIEAADRSAARRVTYDEWKQVAIVASKGAVYVDLGLATLKSLIASNNEGLSDELATNAFDRMQRDKALMDAEVELAHKRMAEIQGEEDDDK